MSAFDELAIEKWQTFQTFIAYAGKLTVFFHLIKRLNKFVLLDEVIDHVMKNSILIVRVRNWRCRLNFSNEFVHLDAAGFLK